MITIVVRPNVTCCWSPGWRFGHVSGLIEAAWGHHENDVIHNKSLAGFLSTSEKQVKQTSSDNKVLHDEVAKELEAPPSNLIWTGHGNDCHGTNVQDPYLYTFIRDFHIKMASLLGLTPLPLLGRMHNSLVKPFFFCRTCVSTWPSLLFPQVLSGSFPVPTLYPLTALISPLSTLPLLIPTPLVVL